MKISRQIWSFTGFALVELLGFGGFWLWEKLHVSIFTICLIIPIGVLILAGIIGMVWSLVEWLVFGMIALHRAAGFRREDLRHRKSSA